MLTMSIWHTAPYNCHNDYCIANLTQLLSLDSLSRDAYIEAMIDVNVLKKGLNCRRFGRTVHVFEEVDSTNIRARELASQGSAEGTVVLAERQTAGRGRLGRYWVSAPGENLTFSIVLRPEILPERGGLLPLATAVGVAGGIINATKLPIICKWPNDLLIAGKKLAGILMESALSPTGFQYVIAGIGVNVNQTAFPDGLDRKATSLALQTGHAIERHALLRHILESLEHTFETFAADGFSSVVPAWLALAPIIETRVTAENQGEIITGTVTGISPDGGLQLQSDAGERTLFAGDVTILDMEHYASRH
jgi:BirA family transcriptional regulator, biotin operon repressor / biotin---[acetyl-CoA-carboxylase] ligase